MAPPSSRQWAAVLLLVLCSSCACATRAAADTPLPPVAAPSAESIVQPQLEAFNARDLDAYMALLTADCSITVAVSGEVLAQASELTCARGGPEA